MAKIPTRLTRVLVLAQIAAFGFLSSVVAAIADTPVPGPDLITGAALKPVVRKSGPPPAPVQDVRSFGAKGDGVTDDTDALRKAIAACAGTGGSVLLKSGTFISANLELKSGMTLYIAEGATLKASSKPADFPIIPPHRVKGSAFAAGCQRSLLFADGVENLAIDGGGTLDGNGRGLHAAGMNMYKPEPTRPCILRVFDGRKITVRNIQFYNPHMWTQVYDHCENLLLEQQTARSMPKGNSYNTDGMDICNCRHAIIRDNDIDSDDDSICLKSHDPSLSEDILITNNSITCHGANAIKFGTATVGDIRNVRIYDNVIHKANLGGLCIESVDGAHVSGIDVKGLTMSDVMHPFFIRLSYRGSFHQITNSIYPKEAGSISNVSIENVVVTPTTRGLTGPNWGNGWREPSCTVTGIATRRLGSVLFKDIRIVMPGGIGPQQIPPPPEAERDYPQSSIFGRIPASVFFVRHADDVRFENIESGTAKPDSRPWLESVDAKVETGNIQLLSVITTNK